MIEISPRDTEILAKWADAVLYCQFLNHNNYHDWRLPTLDEMKQIKSYPTMTGNVWYWVNSEIDENLAECLNSFNYDPVTNNKQARCFVRAVRTI
jgi:formylglycine-generating enzyme required for sulfatase activity